MINRVLPIRKCLAGRLFLAAVCGGLILFGGCSSAFLTGSKPLLDGWVKGSDRAVGRAGSFRATVVERVAHPSPIESIGDRTRIASRALSPTERAGGSARRSAMNVLLRGNDAPRGAVPGAPIAYNATRWVPLVEEDAARQVDGAALASQAEPPSESPQPVPARESTQSLVRRARVLMAHRLADASE